MGSLALTFYLAVIAALAISGVASGPMTLMVSAIIGGLLVAMTFAVAELVRKPHTRES
ncbi:hypothetical protein [Haliangium ochraceum]|uniref:Uncharacterized protein n=1 Tax=Haliangium ochraceum (strain DSM 14365 / JCM 11303 / SMP-2) TaxID=502025 RepID=D0LHZ6_HALO1|nr:hypothetical protein [Haliangium ochraceum]ACY14825.1 hypothetical protein Hoch_2282 [Haliangium ochraceum DSM 14365]